ncbi:MAG: GAF domain-containing protein [Desulfatitalea sp.]|nr:GAF domain-containing protein [Desulfatitalea sp.]NNK00447.1 GAF domain-containing protein [Desulfatitalea sp.]
MKPFYAWLHRWLLKNRSLYGKLNLVFFFFFFVPTAGLVYFGITYDLLGDRNLPIFFAALLGFSFLGLNLLRKLFDDISQFSKKISRKAQALSLDGSAAREDGDELHRLVSAFGAVDSHLARSLAALQHKIHHISILKELSDFCHITADPLEILQVLLERALEVTQSDVGSILLIDGIARKRFTVAAAIGLDAWVKPNGHVDFESSIAKYAVLNKSALIVDDIERDPRFGRSNREHYGAKAFICLPIKASRDIIGVLSISRKSMDAAYDPELVQVLEPLVAVAAFAHENLQLCAQRRRDERYCHAFTAILALLQSSLHGGELLRACLNEVHAVVAFNAALILCRERNRPDTIMVHEMLAKAPALIAVGDHFVVTEGTMIDRILRRKSPAIHTDTDQMAEEHRMEIMGDEQTHTVWLVPLKKDDGGNDVLAVVFDGAVAPGQDFVFLEWAASCLASALERNRLHDAVAKRNQELDSIKQIGGILASSTFDVQQVLKSTMDMIRVIMNVEAGVLYLVKADVLEFAVGFDSDAQRPKPNQLKMGQGIPGHVAARGESMLVNLSHATKLLYPRIDMSQSLTFRSTLCVPMISQGRVIGVIQVINKNESDFGANDEDLLQSIASSVSIAVENAHLYQETLSMAETERGIRSMFQKFVPKEVLENILLGSQTGATLTEELKTLTLLNIDLRGFSKLSITLGPQKTVALLNAFFSLMGGIVFKYGGIVDKYLGDGFLALFGAPISSTADADNALKAALEMQTALETINNGLAGEMCVTLEIGISVHTGEVVVGNIGFDMKMDYTVIGDAVNAVFRLQDLVRPFPNSIFFSANTLRATRMKLSHIQLDERLGDVALYELLGKSH